MSMDIKLVLSGRGLEGQQHGGAGIVLGLDGSRLRKQEISIEQYDHIVLAITEIVGEGELSARIRSLASQAHVDLRKELAGRVERSLDAAAAANALIKQEKSSPGGQGA